VATLESCACAAKICTSRRDQERSPKEDQNEEEIRRNACEGVLERIFASAEPVADLGRSAGDADASDPLKCGPRHGTERPLITIERSTKTMGGTSGLQRARDVDESGAGHRDVQSSQPARRKTGSKETSKGNKAQEGQASELP
jgi:hypothetical protein